MFPSFEICLQYDKPNEIEETSLSVQIGQSFTLFLHLGMCPVLCSGNGDYEDGVCRCFPGWKGIECQLSSNECEVADCNGNGKCVNGLCVCARGFTGKHCKEGMSEY